MTGTHSFRLMIFTASLFVTLFNFNCTPPPSRGGGVTISIDPKILGKETSAWMGYGMKKALWRTETFLKENPGETTYVFTLAEEVECRKSLVEMWLDMKKGKSAKNEYLDDLAAVVAAGFITEYVWHYFKQEYWSAPAELREQEYIVWAQNNIPDHECITLVTVTDETQAQSISPQEQQQLLNKASDKIESKNFKKAQTLLEKVITCTSKGWKPVSERGDSVFCAFWNAEEEKRYIADHQGRVVIPIFPSYSLANHLLGYIAVEQGNFELALSHMNKALALQPDHPTILLEKGTILNKLKQHQEAYDCFVLAEKPHYAASSSTRARALRGQGMSLIDLDRLDEAETCLVNSLKYEPENKIALSEIEYIRQLRSGESSPGADVKIQKVK